MKPANGGATVYAACPSGRDRPPCEFGAEPLIAIATGHPLAPRVEIWRCSICGHGVTRPAMADVAALYAQRESHDFLGHDSSWVQLIKSWWLSLEARQLLRWVDARPTLVVDYGAGNGMLAGRLAARSPEGCRVLALDFFDAPPGNLGRADYMSFAAAESGTVQADLLCCFHVLEHDDDPHRMLDRIGALLRPGGTLVLEVPNIDCVWNPLFGTACANWYVPYHRLHFSRTSLRNLIAGHDFEILAEQDICGPTISFSLAQSLGIKPGNLTFLAGILARPVQWLAERLTRRPSALRIIARKPARAAAEHQGSAAGAPDHGEQR